MTHLVYGRCRAGSAKCPRGWSGVADGLLAEGDRSRIAALINSRLRVQDEGTVDDMIVQAESYGVQDLARLEGLLEVIETRLLEPNSRLLVSTW